MFILQSRRVVLPEGERPASIHIDNGIIAAVAGYRSAPPSAQAIDVGDLVVAPGVVDPHVHVNEPGRTDWEGFDTATRAAAAGGITTIIDMPLNSIPATTTVEALELKRAAARGRIHVDVGFWGGIVPGNEAHLEALANAGARGFKCFLTPSGVDEFPNVNESDLRRVMPIVSRLASGRLVLAHAEDPQRLKPHDGDPRDYRSYLATRPSEAEVAAVRLMASLAAEHDVPTHIVHVSSADGLAAVADARRTNAPLTAETCPHYLTFAADEVPEGGTPFKCAPPIRDVSHREALWSGLRTGTCQMIASDHSPAPPELKRVDDGNFVEAWGGIASLELSLPAVWAGAVCRGFDPHDISEWMSRRTAALCGLGSRKGAIRPGFDADVVVWDPNQEYEVATSRLQQRHKMTPYSGRTLRGVVHSTYVRGVLVWNDGALVHAGRGALV